MRIITSISRCKKSDFKAAYNFANKVFHLRWGKESEVERKYDVDPNTGEPIPTGVEKETEWCTYESGIYRGILTPYLLDQEVLSVAIRHPHLDELRDIYLSIGVEEEQMVQLLKDKLKEQILRYDSSEHVNSFTIAGVNLWLDKATRVGLKLRFEAEKRLGKTETTLWQDGVQFPLPLVGDVTALDMLDGIELYASACYDNTQRHLSVINALESADAIKAYDYKEGYPQKLVFKV